MARREVTADDVSFDGKFLKLREVFPEPGSEFRGIYMSDDEGEYGQNYKFKLSANDRERFDCEDGIGILTAKGPLKSQLAKGKPVAGELVTIKREQDNGQFWVFHVFVDDPPAKGSKPVSKPKNDDIDF